MSTLLASIQELVSAGKIRVSAHGFEELASDDITLGELLDSLPKAVTVEEYQDYHKGPCVLVVQSANDRSTVHVCGVSPRTRLTWQPSSPPIGLIPTGGARIF